MIIYNAPKIDGIRVMQDKKGLGFNVDDVVESVAKETVLNNGVIKRKENSMKEQFEIAESVLEDSRKRFEHTLTKLLESEQSVSEQTKKVSGNVRKAANELSEGMVKIQKLADFDKLERYTELLERCAQAITILAELEQNGKLSKVINAVKA